VAAPVVALAVALVAEPAVAQVAAQVALAVALVAEPAVAQVAAQVALAVALVAEPAAAQVQPLHLWLPARLPAPWAALSVT
jgi:hypothetical protein